MDSKYTCIIVDDDQPSLDIIGTYVDNIDFLVLKDQFNDSLEALKFLKSSHVDILISDIKMPNLNGVELVRSLENPPHVVFTTSSRDHAIEAFEAQVIDYLVKPIYFDRFLRSIEKIKNLLPRERPSPKFFFVKVNGQMIKVFKEEITYIEGYGDYIKINTSSQNYISSTPLRQILDLLDSNFMRIHKSYIIAFDKIDRITGNEVYISGRKLPVGSTYRENLLSRLNII